MNIAHCLSIANLAVALWFFVGRGFQIPFKPYAIPVAAAIWLLVFGALLWMSRHREGKTP